METISIVRTILDWPYKPGDFFESSVSWSDSKYELALERGVARATLKVPQDPVPDELQKEIEYKILSILNARMVLAHRDFSLEGVRIRQERADGSANTSMTLKGVTLIATAGTVDVIHTDAAGRVLKDTRAERIATHQAFIALIANAATANPVLKKLLESYRAAVADPKDELVHLYEIRDAIALHYGSEANALSQLGIAKTKWKRLGILSNAEPVEQSRHRGKHSPILRQATSDELNEAREIACELIRIFAGKSKPKQS